jgi:hypothetical protein
MGLCVLEEQHILHLCVLLYLIYRIAQNAINFEWELEQEKSLQWTWAATKGSMALGPCELEGPMMLKMLLANRDAICESQCKLLVFLSKALS